MTAPKVRSEHASTEGPTPRDSDPPPLGWHEFFQSLATEGTPDTRKDLPREVQE